MGYIYKITNLINQYIYIGKTVHTIEVRWKEHINTSSNSLNKSSSYILYKAMRKYGIDNFKIEELEECDNNLLSEREQYWISIFDSYYLNGHGYNMTLGGEGAIKYSDEDILILWNQGLKSAQIAKQLGANEGTISERLKILKPGEARKRHINSNKKSVLQYNLNGGFIKQWDCATNAEKELQVSTGGITKCCKKERTMAHNSLWKYSTDETPIEELMINYAKSTKCNGVDLIDENGNILEQYSTAAEAERIKHISRGRVSAVCNNSEGRVKTGGLRWQWSYPLKRQLVKLNK